MQTSRSPIQVIFHCIFNVANGQYLMHLIFFHSAVVTLAFLSIHNNEHINPSTKIIRNVVGKLGNYHEIKCVHCCFTARVFVRLKLN